MEYYDRLREREAAGKEICAGLVGCGQMGSGLVHVTHQMPGLETRVVSDIDVSRAIETLKSLGIPEAAIRVTERAGEAEDALRAGQYVVTDDALLLTRLPSVAAVVEATGLTEVGAKVAWHCIENRKHVVMLNVETDVTVGPVLSRLARQAGCVYTVAAGDEPGVCKMLYDQARSLGFEVVCLGKGKNNPIDREATPDSCREEALGKGMNPKMLSAFKDGSKTMVEMAAVSNATGLIPDVPGMHGPKVEIPELNTTFVPQEDGGIFEHRGCVEYTTGNVAPAVFAIVTTEDDRVRTDMRFVSMGPGPYYTLLRPYHLCNIETPLAIVDAVLYGERTVASTDLVSEVVPVAKRDLRPGEVVGEIGSPDFYGLIYTHGAAEVERAIPLGITPGGTVLNVIPKGALLTETNFAPDRDKFVYKLRQLQDAALELD
ncbi:MAG: NAD(P)H-dependent oxidoreductase [Anaerolineae bacterium]